MYNFKQNLSLHDMNTNAPGVYNSEKEDFSLQLIQFELTS